MKISELITILNQYLESEGDLPVIVNNGGYMGVRLSEDFISLDTIGDYDTASVNYLMQVKALNLFDV